MVERLSLGYGCGMDRYFRQTVLKGFGSEAQEKLRRSRVLCVGLGGLGSPAALYLAAAGVGKLGLVDGDRIEVSNLQRQILYSTAEQGLTKAEIARDKLLALNPEVEIEAHAYALDAENAQQLFSEYDLVIDGTDNFEARVLINAAALLAQKPVVFGSVLQFEGRVTVFAGPPGPCYRCLFPTEPAPEESLSCADAGVLGALPGIIGSLQALEAIKYLTGVGTPLVGRMLRYQALEGRFTEIRVERDEDCAHCARLRTLTLPSTSERVCGTVAEMSYADFQTRGENFLIDVREPEEFASRSLAGARNIPLGQLTSEAENWPRTRAITVYCRSGKRGANAARLLSRLGFTSIWNLAGGIDAVGST